MTKRDTCNALYFLEFMLKKKIFKSEVEEEPSPIARKPPHRHTPKPRKRNINPVKF